MLRGDTLVHEERPIMRGQQNISLWSIGAIRHLSNILFINEYCKYYQLEYRCQKKICCDNKEIVSKLNNVINDSREYKNKNEKSERELIYTIIPLLSKQLKFLHVYSYQDKGKFKYKFTLLEQLNDLPDLLFTKYLSSPIENYLPSIPISIYHQTKYIANGYQ